MSEYNYDGFEAVFLSNYIYVQERITQYLESQTSKKSKNDNLINILDMVFESQALLLSLDDAEEWLVAIESNLTIKGILYLGLMDEARESKEVQMMFACFCLGSNFLEEVGICSVSTKERDKVVFDFMSKNGKKGAQFRNEARLVLVKYALLLAENFPKSQSANSIAYEIQSEVIEKGVELGYTLTPQNAQDTIQKWINKGRKNLSV